MQKASPVVQALDDVRLSRLGSAEPAGLLIASLPWPRAAAKPLSLGGRPTHVKPLGQWPREPEGTPRRLLMVADGGSEAPESLSLKAAAAPAGATPTAESVIFETCQETGYMWERSFARISWGGKSIGIAMGLRHGGQTHWWEACRLVVTSETPHCREIEMGGAIPVHHAVVEEMRQHPGYSYPLLHRHNWINGHIYARLHSNGVCEIYAHHINAKFHDDGLPFDDVVPVIGFITDGNPADVQPLVGAFDGSQGSLKIGGATLDVAEVARLATPQQPGRIDVEGKFLVLQPYLGLELFGGVAPVQIKGDPLLCRAEQKHWPRGAARTLRFSLSLNPQRSPRVARYLAPAWMYGACEEILPEPLLPVSNEYDAVLEAWRKRAGAAIKQLGFEDGSMPRYGTAQGDLSDPKRYEPGWEGEVPYGQFLMAWLYGDAQDYADAMRSTYHYTDLAVEHAMKQVRMHGFPPNGFAPPMNRVLGTVAAWLETGDPYLLNTAEAVTETSHRVQLNSWPRLAVGRDACYVRGACLLYRYLGDEHYRRIAHEGAMHVAHSQRPDGSFGDQGGGSGIHQWGAYITKPWMGLLATNGVLDYLALFPDDEALTACAKRFADFMLKIRLPREGGRSWMYQLNFNGEPRHYCFYSNRWLELPGDHRWHQDNIGRLMVWASERFEDPAYIDAWAESFAVELTAAKGEEPSKFNDHRYSAATQFVPWVQAKLWGARWTANGVEARPMHFGSRTPMGGQVLTPRGPVTLKWREDGGVEAPAGVEVKAAALEPSAT